MVLRRCRQLLQNEDKALDAMQDTFVQLLRHEKRLTAGAPSSLLYRIATNICLNVLRSEKRSPVSGKEDLLKDPKVQRRVAELKAANQRILEEYPPGEIAQAIQRRARQAQAKAEVSPAEAERARSAGDHGGILNWLRGGAAATGTGGRICPSCARRWSAVDHPWTLRVRSPEPG